MGSFLSFPLCAADYDAADWLVRGCGLSRAARHQVPDDERRERREEEGREGGLGKEGWKLDEHGQCSHHQISLTLFQIFLFTLPLHICILRVQKLILCIGVCLCDQLDVCACGPSRHMLPARVLFLSQARRVLMRLWGGVCWWGKARGAFLWICRWGACVNGRGLDVSVCHTLYCLYVPHREPDPQQIAGVWCDLAAALFGAFADKDKEREAESQGEEMCRKKRKKNS